MVRERSRAVLQLMFAGVIAAVTGCVFDSDVNPIEQAERATTLVFQEGVAGFRGTVDTYVIENTPAATFGTEPLLRLDGYVGNVRPKGGVAVALLGFDVIGAGPGRIPRGAVVEQAMLKLVIANAPNDEPGAVYPALITLDDESSWESLGQTPGLRVGEDYSSESAGTIPTQRDGPLGLDVTATLVRCVREPGIPCAWVALPGGRNNATIHSSETEDVSQRPRLEVTIRIPAE